MSLSKEMVPNLAASACGQHMPDLVNTAFLVPTALGGLELTMCLLNE